MDMTTRIIVGVVSVVFLVAYALWKWKRAGDYVDAQEAYKQAGRQYVDALKNDPRWHALKAKIEERYPISFDYEGADPSTFVVHNIGLVCDQGFTYRIDNPSGPMRISALLVRKQPPTKQYVSMHLQTGEIREDPAPHGWTYVGPPR